MSDDVTDKAKTAVDQGAEALDEAVDTAAKKTSVAISRVRSKAQGAIDEGQDILEAKLSMAKDIIREHPITSVLAVGAIAYLLGRFRG